MTKRTMRTMVTNLLCTSLAVLALAGTGVSTAAAQSKEKAPEAPSAELRKTEAKPAGDAGAGVDPKTYKIGPEDILRIQVWRQPELSGQFAVRPDGKLTMPLVGELVAGGLTPEQLKDSVVKALSAQLNQPEVFIDVHEVRSKKYFLVGGVQRPGAYPLIVPTTVLDAVHGAGGMKEFANGKKIIILRGAQRLKFNYDEVAKKGKNLQQNIFLEHGDHVVIPE